MSVLELKHRYKYWNDMERDVLRAVYPECPTAIVCKILLRSYGSVTLEANRLGIKKSAGYMSRLRGFKKVKNVMA